MSESAPADPLIGRVVDQVMRGEVPDVEALIASTPELAPATRERLRQIARAFGSHVPGAASDARAPVLLEHDPELPFAALGPYKLISRLGEGGMGVVYLAEHGFLERRVALKIIRPELAASPAVRQRFHREAMRIASLRHEHIVSVYDAGEHGGVAFLAMQLIEGPGLDEILRTARGAGERIPVADAVRHARDIALALQCAHDAGIVHRDVKPSNVCVTADGRALLLDFGLSFGEEATSVSSIAHFRGTPHYASPEQIEGTSADIDSRSDVYSLGVTLYECLTGQVPFTSSRTSQLFRLILSHEPVEPRGLDERVDEVLNAIVMRAMAKRREQRYAHARELAAALDAWLQDGANAAAPTRRTPALAWKALAAALVLALGAAAWLLFSERGPSPLAAAPVAQPVVRAAPRSLTALLGTPDQAFDERLSRWDALDTRGTFGADEDGPGAIGTCVDGLTAIGCALPAGNGSVRARVESLSPRPELRTRAVGSAVEFSNGRIVALLLVAAAEGYELRACELQRDAAGQLVRGAELEAPAVPWGERQALELRLSWNDTDTQFDWDDGVASPSSGSLSVPRGLRGSSRPSRALLLVERGSGRFQQLVLEES